MHQSLIVVTRPAPSLIQFVSVIPVLVAKDPYVKSALDWVTYGRDRYLDPRDQAFLERLFANPQIARVIVLNHQTFQVECTYDDPLVKLICVVIGVHIKHTYLPGQVPQVSTLFLSDGAEN